MELNRLKLKHIFLLALILLFTACSAKNDDKKKLSDEAGKASELNKSKEFTNFKTIKFGKYEQDNNISNGKEDIEWLVIDESGENLLLLSKSVLDILPYDTKHTNVYDQEILIKVATWEKSSLREWLNKDFFDEAFSDEEKNKVIASSVKNGFTYGINNSYEPIDTGNDTADKVYILSRDECRKYLGFENGGICESYKAYFTKSAAAKFAEESKKDRLALWHKEKEYGEDVDNSLSEYWLRGHAEFTLRGAYEFYAETMEKDGHVSSSGYPYYVFMNKKQTSDGSEKSEYYGRGVRPVISIKNDNYVLDDINKNANESGEQKIVSIKDIDKIKKIVEYDNATDPSSYDEVLFGICEQDGNLKNGSEPIEWFVADIVNNKALLVSKKILDYKEYSNVLGKQVGWRDCSLRAYANYEFYISAFNEKEKVLIQSVELTNYDNPIYGMPSGQKTIDKIFLLGFDECIKYFGITYDDCIKETFYDQKQVDSKKLISYLTTYAHRKINEERVSKDRPYDYWLRNIGRCGEELQMRSNNAMTARTTVDFKGSPYDYFKYYMNTDKTDAKNQKLGFRPAMWVDVTLAKKFES